MRKAACLPASPITYTLLLALVGTYTMSPWLSRWFCDKSPNSRISCTEMVRSTPLWVHLILLLSAFSAKPPAKSAAAGSEVRYFTAIDGLMDNTADVILKETRQGKTVTAATLDVCYPVEKGSERKDRFVANLTVSGTTLSGSTTRSSARPAFSRTHAK